jgi:hypothetical protein
MPGFLSALTDRGLDEQMAAVDQAAQQARESGQFASDGLLRDGDACADEVNTRRGRK